MTVFDVQRIRPDLSSQQAADVLDLMGNDGAPHNKESVVVFADWLFGHWLCKCMICKENKCHMSIGHVRI